MQENLYGLDNNAASREWRAVDYAKLSRLGVAAVVSVAILAACGGSSDGTVNPSGTNSRKDSSSTAEAVQQSVQSTLQAEKGSIENLGNAQATFAVATRIP